MNNPVINFLYSWYIDDTKNFWNWFINYLKFLDRDIAVAGSLQNWTSPLFGDYSLVGVVVGPVLRTIRILFGLALYAIISFFSLIIYLFWVILPIGVVGMVFLNLFSVI